MSRWVNSLALCCVTWAVACSSESVNKTPTGGTAGQDSGSVIDGGGTGGVAEACAPKTCADLGAECGKVDDGCGTELTCGECTTTSCSSEHKCCPPVAPINAFMGASVGIVCTPLNALANDSKYAGLDYADTGVFTIDDQSVTACVGVDFGAEYQIDSLIIRGRIVDAACGLACSGQCGTLNTMRVFSGTTERNYEFVASVTLDATNADHTVPLGLAARYVLACRPSGGADRDDIEIDSISSGACL